MSHSCGPYEPRGRPASGQARHEARLAFDSRVDVTVAAITEDTVHVSHRIATRIVEFSSPGCSCHLSLSMRGVSVFQSVLLSALPGRVVVNIWRTGHSVYREVVSTDGVAVLGPMAPGGLRLLIRPADGTTPPLQTEWLRLP